MIEKLFELARCVKELADQRDAAIQRVEQAEKRAEEAKERHDCAVANNAEWDRRYQLLLDRAEMHRKSAVEAVKLRAENDRLRGEVAAERELAENRLKAWQQKDQELFSARRCIDELRGEMAGAYEKGLNDGFDWHSWSGNRESMLEQLRLNDFVTDSKKPEERKAVCHLGDLGLCPAPWSNPKQLPQPTSAVAIRDVPKIVAEIAAWPEEYMYLRNQGVMCFVLTAEQQKKLDELVAIWRVRSDPEGYGWDINCQSVIDDMLNAELLNQKERDEP